MSKHRITLTWEGDLDGDSLELFTESPADCMEFLEMNDATTLSITEILSEVKNNG